MEYIITLGLLMLLFMPVMWMFIKSTKIKTHCDLTPKDIWFIEKAIPLMSPREFEEFCCKLWNHYEGHTARLTQATNDMGRDIEIEHSKEMIYVECKHWSAGDETKTSIGRPIAQKLVGSMMFGDGKTPADKGVIMTTSTFTNECIEYCNVMGIKIMDYDDIMSMVYNIGLDVVMDDIGFGFRD